jgi:cytochrome c biogenesis protein CcmG/thiol:disulfide interchange protein DsbE
MAASRNWLLILPPLLFIAFAAVAWLGLKREAPQELPSALVGQPAPSLERAGALHDYPVPTDADLRGPGVKLVNFFASWCGPCRAEHPLLMELAAEGVPVIGVNYKDQPEAARDWLNEDGNPFEKIGTDDSGRIGLDWGIYGVPETFVVDSSGTILMRYPGPLTRAALQDRLRPAMDAAE